MACVPVLTGRHAGLIVFMSPGAARLFETAGAAATLKKPAVMAGLALQPDEA